MTTLEDKQARGEGEGSLSRQMRRGHRRAPEAGDHLGEADDLLDAVGDQVGQVRQHGEAGALLLAGVGAAALLVVHHQQVVDVHLGVHRLCAQRDQDKVSAGLLVTAISTRLRRVKGV